MLLVLAFAEGGVDGRQTGDSDHFRGPVSGSVSGLDARGVPQIEASLDGLAGGGSGVATDHPGPGSGDEEQVDGGLAMGGGVGVGAPGGADSGGSEQQGQGAVDATPVPAPAARPGARPVAAPAGGVAAVVCAYPWPCADALGVVYGNARCPNGESGGNPLAYNAGNYGLYQINAVHAARVDGDLSRLFDVETNVAVAYALWRDQGWAPWACRP